LADKGYAHDSSRIHLRAQRIAHLIPERSDQIARRKPRGSRGGRPPAFDALTYRHRNTVERGFNRLKTGVGWPRAQCFLRTGVLDQSVVLEDFMEVAARAVRRVGHR
jgi:hypothetical protein